MHRLLIAACLVCSLTWITAAPLDEESLAPAAAPADPAPDPAPAAIDSPVPDAPAGDGPVSPAEADDKRSKVAKVEEPDTPNLDNANANLDDATENGDKKAVTRQAAKKAAGPPALPGADDPTVKPTLGGLGGGAPTPAPSGTPAATPAAVTTPQPGTKAPTTPKKTPKVTVSAIATTVKPSTIAPIKTGPTATANPDGGDKTKKPTAAPTEKPKPTETPTKKPEEGDNDVENSKNKTSEETGTTFHVAVRFTDEKYSDDLEYPINPMYASMKKMLQSAVESVYEGYPDFKQVVLIKFTDSEKKEDVGDKRADVAAAPGVVADFYLRFHNRGKHLTKLSAEIKTGKLGTHPVSKKFVRAYTAEPKGLVCTPDCKIQCFSYCDQGCCHVHMVQNVEMPAAAPGMEGSSPLTLMQQPGCAGPSCGQAAPAAAPCQGAGCGAPAMPPMPMLMPMIQQAPQPCQGPSCGQPAPVQQAAPCQGAQCPPAMPALGMAAPCQGSQCQRPMMSMPAPQAPCQGSGCQGAAQLMAAMAQAPCQGASCGQVAMPQQAPCQGAGCGGGQMQITQMQSGSMTVPCQGPQCAQQRPAGQTCRGAPCPQMPPYPAYAQMAPQPQAAQCNPGCAQNCAPACPTSCCGPPSGYPQFGR